MNLLSALFDIWIGKTLLGCLLHLFKGKNLSHKFQATIFIIKQHILLMTNYSVENQQK